MAPNLRRKFSYPGVTVYTVEMFSIIHPPAVGRPAAFSVGVSRHVLSVVHHLLRFVSTWFTKKY